MQVSNVKLNETKCSQNVYLEHAGGLWLLFYKKEEKNLKGEDTDCKTSREISALIFCKAILDIRNSFWPIVFLCLFSYNISIITYQVYTHRVNLFIHYNIQIHF